MQVGRNIEQGKKEKRKPRQTDNRWGEIKSNKKKKKESTQTDKQACSQSTK